MKKLAKGFEASEKTVSVKIGTDYYEFANLKKSGIVNKTKVLLAYSDQWHEIDVIALGGDDSNLENFKNHIELHNYKLKDFGIFVAEEKPMVYGLTHDDHVKISELFPRFSYIDIGKLHKHITRFNRKTFFADLRDFANRADETNLSMDEYIAKSIESDKKYFNTNTIKTMNPEQRKAARIKQLTDFGATEKDGVYTAFGIAVSSTIIDSFPDAAWNPIIAGMQQAATASKTVPTASPEQAFEKPEPSKADMVDKRIEDLIGVGYIFQINSGNFEKEERSVTMEEVETASDTDWQILIQSENDGHEAAEETVTETLTAEVIPAAKAEIAPAAAETSTAAEQPQTPAKKPVSLETIGALQPARIVELKDLENETTELLAAHPVFEIKTKADRDKLNKSVGTMLKASTAIDSEKTGIKANKNRFLKMFSSTLDLFLDAEAKKRRARHAELKAKVDAWDNAEELRKQKEKKDQLEKIKGRTDSLFAVPMVFDGTVYSIGNLAILPSQIETLPDPEFAELLKQAQDIKIAQDAAAQQETDMITELAEQLAAATNRSVEDVLAEMKSPAATASPVTVQEAAEMIDAAMPAAEEQPAAVPAAATTSTGTQTPAQVPAATKTNPTTAKAQEKIGSLKWMPSTVYTMPAEDNKLMNDLDMQNLENLQHPGYIKCRSYYAKGLKDVAFEIRDILAKGGKSGEIKAFLDIIEKSE